MGMQIERNSIVWADLGYKTGRVQSGMRPCLVVSCNVANRKSPIYTVIPGTSKMEVNQFPVHCAVCQQDVKGCLNQKTTFMVEQICTIDKRQVMGVIGRVTNEEVLTKIDSMILRQLGIALAVNKSEDGVPANG